VSILLCICSLRQALELSAGQLNSTAITLTLDSTNTTTAISATPWRITPEFIAILRAVLRDNLAAAGAHGPLATACARTLPPVDTIATASASNITATGASTASSVKSSDSPHAVSSRRCHVCAAALKGASHTAHITADRDDSNNSGNAVSSSTSSSSNSRGFRCAACACVVCHSCLSAAAEVQRSVVALVCKDCADAAFPELAVRYRAAVRYAYGGDGPCMALTLNLQVSTKQYIIQITCYWCSCFVCVREQYNNNTVEAGAESRKQSCLAL
jgi:hypothetical protein